LQTKISFDGKIAKKFTRLYILALIAVAFLSVLGQVAIQWTLNKQMSDSWIINYAGRQRFKSQQIVKEVLLLTSPSTVVDKQARLHDLKELVKYWEKYHYEIRNGNLKDLGITVSNSDSVQNLFQTIDPYFLAILKNSQKVIDLIESGQPLNYFEIQTSAQKILASESMFLENMDKIVFQYDREAKEKVNTLRQIELILFTITIIVLVLEGLFVFRPAVRSLNESIEQLILAEKRAVKMNEELARQKLREQKLRAASLIEGQEEERKRLSRELHDGLGQMLTALKFGIENIEHHTQLSDKGKKALEDLNTMVGQTIQETRTISFNLMPSVLNDFGIASALKLLVSQTASNTGINISFKSSLNGQRFHKNIEIGLYRIAQEGINNALKYAKGDTILVDLDTQKKFIYLTIADNGKGFSYNPKRESFKPNSPENGISNMRERCHLLNGEIKINSKLGKGTEIKIKVPLGTKSTETV
jgi:two-component system, NarL family, sensor histidine kinase DegS